MALQGAVNNKHLHVDVRVEGLVILNSFFSSLSLCRANFIGTERMGWSDGAIECVGGIGSPLDIENSFNELWGD